MSILCLTAACDGSRSGTPPGWRMLSIHFGHCRSVYDWFREVDRRFLFQTIHNLALMLGRD